jgi:hypothetical protein
VAMRERRNCYLSIECYGDAHEQLAGAVTLDWPRAMVAARSVLAAGGRVGTAHDRWLELAGRSRPLTVP